MPVKWVREPNLHLTLSFLGHITDDSLKEICGNVRSAAQNRNIFDIEFNKIEIGPAKGNPRFIWLTGAANEDLRQLQEELEKKLGIFIKEKREFHPHITLGRIRKHKWKALSQRPEISEKFNLIVPADSADIMASDFENEGTEYAIIQSYPLR